MVSAEANDDSVAGVNFSWTAGEAVREQRIDSVDGRGAAVGNHLVNKIITKLGALRPPDGGAFADDFAREIGGIVPAEDARRLEQEAGDHAGGVKTEFPPDRGREVGGGGYRSVDPVEQRNKRPTESGIADHHPGGPPLRDGGGRAFRRAVDHHGENTVGRRGARKPGRVFDAILDDGDWRAGGTESRQPGRRSGRIVGFGGDEHPIDGWCRAGIDINGWGELDRPSVSVDAQDWPRAPGTEDQLVPVLGMQEGGQDGADSSGSDDGNARHRVRIAEARRSGKLKKGELLPRCAIVMRNIVG